MDDIPSAATQDEQDLANWMQQGSSLSSLRSQRQKIGDFLRGTLNEAKKVPENVVGAAEATASLGSALGLMIPSFVSGAIRQEPAGAMMERNMYIPRTEAGARHLQGAGELLSAIPDVGPLPELQPFVGVSKGVGQQLQGAARKAGQSLEQAGMAAERAMEPVVRAGIERGGITAEMLKGITHGTTSNVVRPKGTNVIGGNIPESISYQLKPLRLQTAGGTEPAEALRQMHEHYPEHVLATMEHGGQGARRSIATLEKYSALNNWIDRNLGNYVKKEMGTPEDPVRKLAETGVTHIQGMRLEPGEITRSKRAEAGFPKEGFGQSPQARSWENLSDRAIDDYPAGTIQAQAGYVKDFEKLNEELNNLGRQIREQFINQKTPMLISIGETPESARKILEAEVADRTAGELAKHLSDPQVLKDYLKLKARTNYARDLLDTEYAHILRENPWIEKLDPNTRLYTAKTENLEFDHIVDVLREDLDSGRIRPDQLNRVSVADAVRRTYEYDQEMAKKAQKAQDELGSKLLEENAFISYDNGYKWVKLPDPAESKQNRKLVQDIGCQGGWCTQDESNALYYGAHGEGNSLYVLMSPDKRVHAQIHVEAPENPYPFASGEGFTKLSPQEKAQYSEYVRQWRQRNPNVRQLTDEDVHQALREAGVPEAPPTIQQIKPRANSWQSRMVDDQIAKNPDYQPTIQRMLADFVKTTKYPVEYDLENTGLIRFGSQYIMPDEAESIIRPQINEALSFLETHPSLQSWREAQRKYENFEGSVPSEEYARLQRAAGKPISNTIPYTFRELEGMLKDPGAYTTRNEHQYEPAGRAIGIINKYKSELPSENHASGGLVSNTDRIAEQLRANGMDEEAAFNRALMLANEVQMAQGGEVKMNEGGGPITTPLRTRKRPKGTPERDEAMGEALLQGVANMPYNLLGMPVDLATMLMRPFGYETEAPVGGSDWLKGKATQAGIRPEPPADPTAQAIYNVADVASGFVNPLPAVRTAGSALEMAAKKTGQALAPAAAKAAAKSAKGIEYETTQQGPFFRVQKRTPEETGQFYRGIREQIQEPTETVGGTTGVNVPQSISGDALRQMMADPSNFVRSAADQYARQYAGGPYDLPQIPQSSLAKQSAIGRVFQLAAEDDPAYKKAVFDAYAKRYPKMVEASGAKNYDQLVQAAYMQLAREAEQQFHSLPVRMSFHRQGEGNYLDSNQMLRDVYGNKHLYVYQGGEPHPFLNVIDPRTGLNSNEMFRAVHDFYGHAIHGNQFGPKGEEIAWAAHGKMFSPLARLAMTTETRGQNSFVNYTPINAELKRRINKLNELAYEADRAGKVDDVKAIKAKIAEAYQDFQFAPQKSVLLPPEFIDYQYSGGVPNYIQPLIKPEAGTTAASELTHYSNVPSLTQTSPSMYGTGIAGEEAKRLAGFQGAVKDRTYFYTGEPGSVRPEPGLGPHRYKAKSSQLYDISQDPLLLRILAAEANRTPYTSPYNKGLTDPGQAFTDVERMVKEYGYEGLMNPQQRTAIMYGPMPVEPFAKGGEVKMSGGGLKVLSKALGKGAAKPISESESNLAKFLEKSKVQNKAYHATNQDVSRFDPTLDQRTENNPNIAGWFAKDPEFANDFASQKYRYWKTQHKPWEQDPNIPKGVNIMPVHLAMANPFDASNLIKNLSAPLDIHEANLVAAALNIDTKDLLGSIPKTIKYKQSGSEREHMPRGFDLVKSTAATDAMKRLGYDGVIAVENGSEVYAPFQGTQIKSAIGNRGTYDPLETDINKRKGGEVKMSGGGLGLGKVLSKGAAKAAAKVESKPIKEIIVEQAEVIAQQLKADNPKLKEEEIAKRALRQAEAKVKWELEQKPELEQRYGMLSEATYKDPLAQRQTNVPSVVEQRAKKAEEFLALPTEPWTPPKPELQAFDRAAIQNALEGFPGIEQSRFPRYQPAKAGLEHIEEIYNNPRNRALIKSQIARGLPLGGETFYASLYPIKLAALERGIPEQKFNEFIYSTAPASARNSILNEMAVGQFLRDMKARGLPLDEETVKREMQKFKEKYGTGLPLMPIHREGVRNVLEGNQDLRAMLQADIPTNYKIPTYGTQKAGDFAKSMVLDVHEAGGQTQASKYHPYFNEQGGFSPTEYGAAESQMLDIAKEMGLPGGMAQAGRWFGGGELTGLKSPRGDALDLLERQAAYTMQGLGIKPTPRNTREYILKMIESGEGVLMPWFKKEGIPDVRTQKKKGGEVKMAGGGLKVLSKGAAKAASKTKGLTEVEGMVAKMGEEGRTPIVPVPNRWFLQPDKFPQVQPLVEKILDATGKSREDFSSGAFVNPKTGEVLDSRVMEDVGVVINPNTGRPMMSGKESGLEMIDPKLGSFTKSNLVRKSLFKPTGGDPLLQELPFIATIEKGGPHFYGLSTEYASPTEMWNTMKGDNPTLRPKSRGDLFGMGDVVGMVRLGSGPEHEVYEKLFVAPKGSDVPGKLLKKRKGGKVSGLSAIRK